MRLETVACNLCGATRHDRLFEKLGHLTGHRFRIARCVDCGLVFVNPRLSEQEITALYRQAYFEGEGFDPFVGLEQEAQKVEGAARALTRIETIKPPPADLLEVGPGKGHLLREATSRGFRAVGLELSDYAADQLLAQGLKVLRGSIDTAGIGDASFDVVAAVEVLEHLPDPKQFLLEVARVLKPGGLFYYETGDIDCEQARQQGVEWDYIRPEGHIYYFSPRTLARYLRESGFSVCYPAWFNPTRRIVWVLNGLGLLDCTQPVLPNYARSFAWHVLAAWDGMFSRRPYPMATRR